MKKNILNTESANAICQRVLRLTPGSKPIWGNMTATEMLAHCNSCNIQVLREGNSGRITSTKQYLLRILALYIAPNFKKNLSTEKRHDMKGKIDESLFGLELQRFSDTIRQFPMNSKRLTLHHPAFGNISTNQWGIAVYKHMDHHLRQFGV